MCCYLTSLHKKTVAPRSNFYNPEVDTAEDNMYNILSIYMRRVILPHNANYVVKEDRRGINAACSQIRNERVVD